jgi:four helix bundle protein
MNNFKELIAWQKARKLHKEVYLRTKLFPKEELYGLTSQIRRSANSICSNIAEGCGRNTDADLCRFLDMALGSAFELESHLILSFDMELLSDSEYAVFEISVNEIQKLLRSFRESKLKQIQSNV